MPELSALETLIVVARTGSLRAAAAQLGRTQQALSSRIAAIEAQTGVTMVLRTPQGSTLTEAGGIVVEWAARLLDQATELDVGLATLRQEQRVRLRVAASLTIAERLLPGWLVDFDVESPAGPSGSDARSGLAELRVGNSGAVAGWVRTGDADVGFVEGPSAPAGCRSRIIGHDRLVLVVPPTHPWAARSSPISARQLATTALVTREAGSGTRDALAAALRAVGDEPARPAAELSTTAAVRTAVLAGAGPAVLSALVVAEDLAAGRLRRVAVSGIDLDRSLRAIWLGGRTPPAGSVRRIVAIATRPTQR